MSIPLKDASSRENFGKPSSCASKSQEWIQWSIMAGSGRFYHRQEDQQHFSNTEMTTEFLAEYISDSAKR